MASELDRMQPVPLDDEPPFSKFQRSSNRLDSGFSTASSAAADNLLAKAIRRIEAGEPDRARFFVERAVRLP